MLNLEKIKNDLKKLLINLGETVEKDYKNKNKEFTLKRGVNDLLTKTDIKVNNKILSHLKKNYPEITIISEEAPQIKKNSEYAFVIDPIDGTRNFVKNIPVFFIGIALIKNNRTILCTTYNPITKELFWAIRNKGAYLNDSRLCVSNTKFENSDISIRYRKNKIIHKKIVSNIVDKIFIIKNSNCLHNDFGSVAFQRLDGLVHKGAFKWDYCHYLLVEEAGGRVTDWDGKEFDLSKNNIIASNGVVHSELLEVVK